MKRPAAPQSLQWRLSAALFAVILLTGALAGVASFLWALHDANEILDGTLRDTAGLLSSGQISLPTQVARLAGAEPDDDLLVIPLQPDAGVAAPLAALPEGLHTVRWEGRSWRVLVTAVRDGARLGVAQRTEVRDEIAQHSAARTLIPILLLIPLLILLVRQVVARALLPVSELARHVDTHAMTNAANLPEVDIPSEISPFVQSIKRLLGELTATLAHQQRFVANAAHELRSPVAALLLQASNMERVLPVQGPARARLALLQGGITRMQSLLDQLLSMARSEAPTGGEMTPVALDHVAREVLAMLVPQAQAKGVDLGMERCEQGVCVSATLVDLVTLLHNVTENAVKYGLPGTLVSLSVFADAGDAVVVVVDDGPGIAAQHMPRLFEPFYRASVTGEPGTGLGLSIVAAIAKRLGGRISLASEGPGCGVRFKYRQTLTPCRAA